MTVDPASAMEASAEPTPLMASVADDTAEDAELAEPVNGLTAIYSPRIRLSLASASSSE